MCFIPNHDLAYHDEIWRYKLPGQEYSAVFLVVVLRTVCYYLIVRFLYSANNSNQFGNLLGLERFRKFKNSPSQQRLLARGYI